MNHDTHESLRAALVFGYGDELRSSDDENSRAFSPVCWAAYEAACCVVLVDRFGSLNLLLRTYSGHVAIAHSIFSNDKVGPSTATYP